MKAPQLWLLSMADPQGPHHPLPPGRLRPRQSDSFRHAADWHGVLPSVAANLRAVVEQHGRERVVAGDRAARERLDGMLSAARARLAARAGLSLALRLQLRDIMEALAERALPVLVLKGAEFCDRLYPQPALRPFTDVDLLAGREAVPQVEAVLEALGYRPDPAPRRKHAEGYGERTWRRDEPGGAVEVHWNLVNSPPLRRRISVDFGDLQLETQDGARRPTASSLLAIAAVHAAVGHRFDRLQTLCDVCQAARGAAGGLDEDWLREFGRRTGSAGAMASALWLAGETLSERRCGELRVCLFGRMPGAGARLLLSPGVVLRSRCPLPKLRRQLYRELLKRQ